MKKFLITLVVLGISIGANAAEFIGDKGKPNKGNDAYNKANCPPSSARIFMDFNDVKALVEVGGSLWQNRQTSTASYEVPVGGGNHVLFSGSIWMGGNDINGQLKLAAVKFRQGNDFWPGPLSVTVGTGDYDPRFPVGDDAIRDFGAATIDPDVCIEYDKFFPIAKAEVINFILKTECENNPPCLDDFPLSNDAIQRIYNWPAHGDITRGQDYYLAPFYDAPIAGGTGDGIYDPDQGDVPWFDDILGRDDVQCGFDRRVTLFGDKTNWWVFNDKGNIHTETGADPIGMEIHAQAFSFATNDEVNQMTFYNYEMINRSTQTLYDTYFTQYADADVGYADDDYVGCDVSRGLGFAYNGANHDPGQGGAPGYGDNVPAIGIDFFEGPYQDADSLDNIGPHMQEQPDGSFVYYVPTVQEALDGKGIVYEGIGIGYSDGIIDNERFGMRRFNYYNRQDMGDGSGSDVDPSTPGGFYNYMNGFWLDNTPFVYGGTGRLGSPGATTTPAAYTYPGDSDPYHWGTEGVDMGWGWSERNVDGGNNTNPIGDRRFLQTAGPFTLTPGAINNLTVGVVYGRAFEGNAAASIDVLLRNDTKAQALFDNCFEIMDPPTAPVLEIVELENELILLLDNPYGNNMNESFHEEDNINIPDSPDPSDPYDKFYTFEGYQIYQMLNEEAKVSDIGDNRFARLVAQCDIKNDIDRVINFIYDEELGFSVPTEMVNGENKGIRHSFRVQTDMFTNKALVNHKTYYYIAIAYAHNEYKKYSPDDAGMIDGQKTPYISSRLAADGGSINAVAGIPHSPAPRFDGTITQLQYGDSPEITTLDGRGNGNRAVDLTKATEDFIVEHGSIDTPTYQRGKGPIGVKVIDPLNLVDGYFLLKFDNYAPHKLDTASWTLERYSEKGGDLLETVKSNVTINRDNEQLIPQWGISVQINQVPFKCPEGVSSSQCSDFKSFFHAKIAEPIESTMTFSDSSRRWLSGVSNTASYSPDNWIASGTTTTGTAGCLPDLGLFDPCCYNPVEDKDPHKLYTNILGGTMTIGQLARRIGSADCTDQFFPLGVPNGSPAIPFSAYRPDKMGSVFQTSVDIVITSDKSKWTRTPVIELGADPNLNVGGARPGLLRKSPSVDKNGRKLGDPGYNASEANPDGDQPTGMGWFPGYAIDVETGRRLNMAFAENSFLAGENGADMIWNPTSTMYGNSVDINGNLNPVLGGQHAVYVFGRPEGKIYDFSTALIGEMPTYDKGRYIYDFLSTETITSFRKVYNELSWVLYPMLAEGEELLSSDVRIRVRINQMYGDYEMTGAFGNSPTYEWNMDGFKTIKNDAETLASALDIINVVPNPYYAYSEYERGRLDTRVKITNLPERCKVRIYNTSGKLIRAFDKDSPITSLDWDLKNSENISVAGGVYLIHVHVEGIGDRVVKFFGGMRAADLENL